jgi:hypothetical protein
MTTREHPLPSQGPRTYRGGCHCGVVRYEVELDLSAGVAKCTCAICTKTGGYGMTVEPVAFELLSGMDSLTDYQFNSKSIHHYFCRHCGVRSFTHGINPETGGDFFGINLCCLDDIELPDEDACHWDGKTLRWDQSAA